MSILTNLARFFLSFLSLLLLVVKSVVLLKSVTLTMKKEGQNMAGFISRFKSDGKQVAIRSAAKITNEKVSSLLASAIKKSLPNWTTETIAEFIQSEIGQMVVGILMSEGFSFAKGSIPLPDSVLEAYQQELRLQGMQVAGEGVLNAVIAPLENIFKEATSNLTTIFGGNLKKLSDGGDSSLNSNGVKEKDKARINA